MFSYQKRQGSRNERAGSHVRVALAEHGDGVRDVGLVGREAQSDEHVEQLRAVDRAILC